MGKWKVCVYAICKNEAKFVRRWMDSMREADWVVVLDTGGAVENAGADKTADRIQIANTLGALLKRLLDDGLESTVLIMGGDCLLGLMRQLDVTEIMPLCEVAPGVVLSQFTYGGRQWNLVSKSGGFGAKTLFYDLQNILERWKKELPAV